MAGLISEDLDFLETRSFQLENLGISPNSEQSDQTFTILT